MTCETLQYSIWRSNFENTSYITRENQSYSLCKSTKICIAYTDAFTLMFVLCSSALSSWGARDTQNYSHSVQTSSLVRSLLHHLVSHKFYKHMPLKRS